MMSQLILWSGIKSIVVVQANSPVVAGNEGLWHSLDPIYLHFNIFGGFAVDGT